MAKNNRADIYIEPIYLPDNRKPKALYDLFEKEIEAYLRGKGLLKVKNAMKKRVVNWKHKPIFAYKYSTPSSGVWAVTIFPKGKSGPDSENPRKLWEYVSFGVRARPIYARNAPMLKFRPGYDAKTKAGNKYGGSGRRFGPLVETPRVLNWPGIEPRNFEMHIIDELEDDIRRDVQQIAFNIFKT